MAMDFLWKKRIAQSKKGEILYKSVGTVEANVELSSDSMTKNSAAALASRQPHTTPTSEQKPPSNRRINDVVTALFLATIVAAFTLLALWSTPAIYKATALIMYETETVRSEWDLIYDETRNIDFEEQIRSKSVLAPVLTDLTILPGHKNIFQKLIDFAITKVARSPDTNESASQQSLYTLIDNFQDSLEVERERSSSIIRISVLLPSEELAANTANAITKSFIDFKRQQTLLRAEDNLTAIEAEIKINNDELQDVLNRRSELFTLNGWSDFDKEWQSSTSRLAELKEKNIHLTNFDATQIATAVDSDDTPDEVIRQLSQDLSAINARYIQVKSRFKEDSPLVAQIAREKTNFQTALTQYINSQQRSVAAQIATVENEIQKLTKARPVFESLQGEIDHAQQRHQDLLNQRSNLRLQTAALQSTMKSFGNLRILDAAVAPPSVSPLSRLLKILATAAAVFIITFCLVLICREVWRQSFIFLGEQHPDNA